MWKGVRRGKAISIIDSTDLEPSAARVLSSAACELLCSYNWQHNKEASIQIPGTFLTTITLSSPSNHPNYEL